jgi:FAD/FMN-containing dehydrogenase
MPPDHENFLGKARLLVGTKNVLTDQHDLIKFCKDWRGRYTGSALAVILPKTTAEVAAIVQLCRDSFVSIVPQAGNTGLTGGAVPVVSNAVILNVSRMNQLRELDPVNNAITAEAGCILADVRAAADAADRQFPMLLGSVGSCEIGGLVSTNAGGTGVLRYGNMRELVLGLEVVLPDGRIWNGLRALRKDNSGYDLKQLFIGAEGTLGIVTAATLKLFSKPTVSVTAMVALESVARAVELLHFMRSAVGERIEAFEIMSKSQLDIVLRHRGSFSSPVGSDHPWYVLMEVADITADWDMLAPLQRALEEEIIVDAAIATDIAKAERIWELRHNISEANKQEGFTVSNDTSVPISKLSLFIDRAEQRLRAALPDATVCHCGHIGDGNIHVIILLPRALYTTPAQCEAAATVANSIVHEASVELGGSISAEHGVGLMHIEPLERYKSPLDLEMMRMIKSAFDPDFIMNPSKIFRPPQKASFCEQKEAKKL